MTKTSNQVLMVIPMTAQRKRIKIPKRMARVTAKTKKMVIAKMATGRKPKTKNAQFRLEPLMLSLRDLRMRRKKKNPSRDLLKITNITSIRNTMTHSLELCW